MRRTTDISSTARSYRSDFDTQRSKTADITDSRQGVIASTSRSTSATRRASVSGGYSTLDEVKKLKFELDNCQKSLQLARKEQNDLHLKVKVLEDALEFKCDEIGLSGHADLLSKLAHLRGEVTTLKNEINDKHHTITEVEMSKLGMENVHESLKRQIAVMQQKLVSSERELSKYQMGDIGNQLKTVEKERDVLLEFIQGDMEKSAVIAKRLEEVESEYRISKKNNEMLENRLSNTESRLEKELERSNQLQNDVSSQSIRLLEAQKINEMLEKEKEYLLNSLNKKETETEEMTHLQLNCLVQLKEKDEIFVKMSSENKALSMEVADLREMNPKLRQENEEYKATISRLEDERRQLKNRLDSTEPRLAKLEPEIARLRNDKIQLAQDKQSLFDENDRLKRIENNYQQLVSDLEGISLQSLQESLDSSVSNHSQSPQRSRNSTRTTISQLHAEWVSLPSLRTFCPPLYEKLRKLMLELHRIELQNQELSKNKENLSHEAEISERQYREEISHLSQLHDNVSRILDDTRHQLIDAENEVNSLKSLRMIVDQIKATIRTFPGGLMNLFLSDKKNFDADEISDHMLVDIINRIVVHNSSAVVNFQDAHDSLQRTKQEVVGLQSELQELRQENTKLRFSVEELGKSLAVREESYRLSDNEYRQELDAAAELAEKQNALTITLEAKLEAAKRDKQLKSALITSLQQREDSLRDRLYKSLEDYSKTSFSFSTPSKSCKLVDLIDIVADLLDNFRTRSKSKSTRLIDITEEDISSGGDSIPKNLTSRLSSGNENFSFASNSFSEGRHLSIDDISSSSTQNMMSSQIQSNRSNEISSNDLHASNESRSTGSRILQSSHNNQFSTMLDDSTSKAAKSIQDRLKRAQLSFAAMREGAFSEN